MRYEPGFVDWGFALWRMGILGLSMLIVMGVFKGLLLFTKLDRNAYLEKNSVVLGHTKGRHSDMMALLGGVVSACCIYRLIYKACIVRAFCGGLLYIMVLLGIMAGSLLAACMMDLQSCQVYNYVWWVGGAAGLGLLYTNIEETLFSVVVFAALQELLFAKFYGRADCHAFVVCALVEGAFGLQMKGYLIHMLFAFGMLAIIQLLQGNVGTNGNLKKPVPFLPYITISFWSIMLLY